MNRYERGGVLSDVRAGKRVVLVDARRASAIQTFREIVADALDGEWKRVQLINGDERAYHIWGGELIPKTIGSGLRGLVCDIVAADNFRQMTLDQEQAVRMFAALAGNADVIACSG